MVTSLIIQHLLSDENSLWDYSEGKLVAFSDVKRRLFLLNRAENRNIPDHYYKLNEIQSFKEVTSLKDVLSTGLYRIAKEYLELRGKRVYIKQGKQTEWQALLTRIPPLILVSVLLAYEQPLDVHSMDDVKRFYVEYILPNAKYSALPNPYLPQLDMYVKNNSGFHDLHMHLNGTTETDVAWQDFLFTPDKIYQDLEEAFDNSMAREQFEQEDSVRTRKEFLKLLKVAQSLRSVFFEQIYPQHIPKDGCECISQLLHSINDPNITKTSVYTPFYYLVAGSLDYYNTDSLLPVEALMYVMIIKTIRDTNNECLESLFHYYLLILGLTNRLLVQQTHQFGFAQFQKITVNELRSTSEKEYTKRFHQLHGNDLRFMRFLEGRFAPKDTERKTEELLANISQGWKALTKNLEANVIVTNERGEKSLPQLKLIAHFIKRPDNKPNQYIRYKKLRLKLWNQAQVLSLMKQNGKALIDQVVGVDAASSEFDAPPEVFAPIYRLLRRKGFKHFTYHAGEDFFHLLSGLRAIYEAITFTELEVGDRIGHAVAAGLSPQVWMDNVGEEILIRRGEYLDDLVFTYHLIISNNIECLEPRLPFLVNKIQELFSEIYKVNPNIAAIERAWLLRKHCPIIIDSLADKEGHNKFEAQVGSSIFDYQDWCDISNEIKTNSAEDVDLLEKYHSKHYRSAYDEIIKVNVLELFSIRGLEQIQLAMLKLLHKKEIVIETLPTSNVRIGHHHDFSTYHLGNWLRWEKEGYPIPPIVVGTDDTGIFATNIYNEFANIYEFLTLHLEYSHSNAMSVLKQFEENARIYKFT